MSNVYDIGDLVTLTGRFYSDAALTVLADPTTAALTIRNPAGVTITPSVTHASTGTYTYSWSPLVPGVHIITWTGTGSVQSADPEEIVIRASLDKALATTEYIQGVLGSTGAGNADIVARLAIVCSEHIMNYCERRFLPSGASSAKTFRVRAGARSIDVTPWDFDPTVTPTIVVDPTGANTTLVTETDYYLNDPSSVWGVTNSIVLRYPLNASRTVAVSVTATWGWPVIPVPVQEACAYWVRDLIRAVSAYPQNATLEDPGVSVSEGAMPAVCRQLLARYKRVVLA